MTKERYGVLCVTGLLVLLGAGCASSGKPRVISDEKRATIQTHDFTADMQTVWDVTLDVLQDGGWQLGDLDKANHIIRAATQKAPSLVGPQDDWRKPNDKYIKRLHKEARKAAKHKVPYPEWSRWTDAVVRLEAGETSHIRMRLAITKHGTLASGAKAKKAYAKKSTPVVGQEQSLMVDDPRAYSDFFEKIERKIAIRQGVPAPKPPKKHR